MARFEVFGSLDDDFLLLDLQANLFGDALRTRVVAPLYDVAAMSWALEGLNPRFQIDDKRYVLATQRLGAVEAKQLGPVVADLSAHADQITRALDFLFQGF